MSTCSVRTLAALGDEACQIRIGTAAARAASGIHCAGLSMCRSRDQLADRADDADRKRAEKQFSDRGESLRLSRGTINHEMSERRRSQ